MSQADRIPALLNGLSSHPDKFPPSRFSLDTAGIASLVGGDDAMSAMKVAHVQGNRRWLGWYNNPGSFQIAKQFHALAESVPFSTSTSERSVPIESGACKRPRFRAAHSGTVMEETGYLASLFMKECTALDSKWRMVPGRATSRVRIAIVDIGLPEPADSNPFTRAILAASISTIATSISACALCAIRKDWYASSLILLGIVASGVSCLVLGSADLVFTHPEPAKGSPSGDGILGSGGEMVLLRGTEKAVNSITRGSFSLRFSGSGHPNLIKWCSVLFFIQSIAQLLLVSQASLFGQVMFALSLGVSALFNAWISSADQKIYRELLFKREFGKNLAVKKYILSTRTTAVVFILFVLQLQDPAKLLDELLPNDTKVWKQWKAMVLEQLRHRGDRFSLPESNTAGDEFTQGEQDLLKLLCDDARAAYRGYEDYLGNTNLL